MRLRCALGVLGGLTAAACLDSAGFVDSLGPSVDGATHQSEAGSPLDAAVAPSLPSTEPPPPPDHDASTSTDDDGPFTFDAKAPSPEDSDAALGTTSTSATPPVLGDAASSWALDATAPGTSDLPSHVDADVPNVLDASVSTPLDAASTAPPTARDASIALEGGADASEGGVDASEGGAELDASDACTEDCETPTCLPGQCPPGAACSTDSNCLSDHCEGELCAPGYQGAPCESNLDCYAVCDQQRCLAGSAWTPCQGSADCLSSECDDNLCAVGYAGADCANPTDCHSSNCTDSACEPGFQGAACRSNGDCHSDDCGASDTCDPGPPNTPCQTPLDCETELCNATTGRCEAHPLTLLSTVPVDNKTGVAGSTNLTLTFSEDASPGTGSINIYRANGTLFEAIPVSSMRVAISGETVTVNPTGTLVALNGYYVLIDAGAFESPSGGQYAGLSDSTAWNFTTLL